MDPNELVAGLLTFTSQFVVPDWGALIALLPVFLAIPLFLYISMLAYRWATAGPTRRGKRRLPPVAPAGVHMPGPSFAPLLAAAGALFLVFGIVVGGLWLWIGLAILVITLLYWGREALRDYDTMPAGNASGEVVGILAAPAGSPPEGVHMPPPSFRPLLVAVAMTMLVAGMVIGGWAFLVGALAVVITGLGWLLDSRREYRAVETADRTGHLDLGGAPSWPKATFAALAILVAVGLLFSSGVLPNSGGGAAPAASAAAGGGQPAGGGGAASGGASAAPSLPAADVSLSAVNIAFVPTTLTAPAGKAFTLAFDNQDTVPHDVVIKDGGGTAVFTGEIVTGPKVVVYDVPSIPAGSYTFVCSIHPNMTGSITAQ